MYFKDSNITNIYFGAYTFYGGYYRRITAIFVNCLLPSWPLPIRNDHNYVDEPYGLLIFSFHHNKVFGNHRAIYNRSYLYRNLTCYRQHSNESVEFIPTSSAISNDSASCGRPFDGCIEKSVPPIQQTRYVYLLVQGYNNGNDLTSDNTYFEAIYYDSAGHEVIVKSTLEDDPTNLTWNTTGVKKRLKVTFTPDTTTDVTYRANFGKYAASSKIYVDTKMYRESSDGRLLPPFDMKWDHIEYTTPKFNEVYV